MSYRQEILKPLRDDLVSLGFTEPKRELAIGIPDHEDRWKEWNYPKIQEVLYRQQITDDFNNNIDISIKGSDKTFSLSIKLSITVLSIERLAAVLIGRTFDVTERLIPTVMLDLDTEREPILFTEPKRDLDCLQVSKLIDIVRDVAIPFFRNHSTIESLLPDLKAANDHRTKYMTLPLALILLKQPEQAFELLQSYEQMGLEPVVYVYENMSTKLKTNFPELTKLR